MGSNRSVRGLTLPLLVLAVVPSALVSAGATRADAATCGSLNRATGPAAAGELSNAAFVSAGESWAAGNGAGSLRPDGLPSIDRFYINTGDGSFSDDPAMGLDLNVGSLCAHTVDHNSDGWPDLLVCGETGGLHHFENDQGQGFTDVSSILGAQVNTVDAAMVDVNHDGRADLITLTGTKVAERLHLVNGTFGKFKNIFTVKKGRTPAVGDVNGDNNPDIYVVCGRIGSSNAPDYLLTGTATGAFAPTTIPQTTAGGGNRAYPVDHAHDGLSSFLILNGQVPNPGPIQLPTPQPTSMRALTRTVSFHSGAVR